jgi:hypothetical protein
VPDELEIPPLQQVLDIHARAGEKIVEAQNVVAARDEPVAQMATQETGPAGDKNRSHAIEDAF